MMSGFSLRLTHKITAIGIVGATGVVLVGAVHLYGETAMAAYRDAAEHARTISELNGKVEVELLEGRRAERDFLLRNDTKRAESRIETGKSVAADPRPNDSRRSSIANLNFAGGGAFDFPISTRSIGPAILGKKYVQAQFN